MGEWVGTHGGGGDDIGVPSAIGDFNVVKAVLLLSVLAKDVAKDVRNGSERRTAGD